MKNEMEQLIKIAADSIQTLRLPDVFRVLEWNSESRTELAEWIKASRPDLASEVDSCISEL